MQDTWLKSPWVRLLEGQVGCFRAAKIRAGDDRRWDKPPVSQSKVLRLAEA